MQDKTAGFIDFFKEIPDHWQDRRKLHKVEEILRDYQPRSFVASLANSD